MLKPTRVNRLLDDNPRFRGLEWLRNPVMSSNGGTESEYLAGWVTGWIELVDEDKERLGKT